MTGSLVPFNGGVQVIQRHSMFDLNGKTARIVEYRHQSIEDLYREFVPSNMPCTCSISGKVVPREEWPLTFVSPSDSVLFVPTVHGSDGKSGVVGVLLVIAAIAVAVYAPQFAVYLAANGMASLTTAVAVAQYSMYAAYALGALGTGLIMSSFFHPPELAAPEVQGSLSSWTPQTTQAQGGCVPKYYGTLKLYGNVIGTYVETVRPPDKSTDDQYLHALIALGRGPYSHIREFKINNIDTNTLRGVRIITRQGLLTQDVLPGFETTPVNYPETQRMLYNVPVVRQTMGDANFDKLTVSLLFAQGLGRVNDSGSMEGLAVPVEVKIKRAVDSEWIYLTQEPSSYHTVTVPGGQWVKRVWRSSKEDGGYWNVVGYGGFDPNEHHEGDYAENSYTRWHWTGTYKEATGINNYQTISDATRNRKQVDYTYEVPPTARGAYDISVTRLSADTDDMRIVDKVDYAGHTKSYFEPYSFPRHALVAVRALLTDQLSGSFRFSCVGDTSIVNVYDPVSQTWTAKLSLNPAWVCYDVLTSPVFYDDKIGVASADQDDAVARYDGVDPDRLPLDYFVEYAAFCDELVSDGHAQSIAYYGGLTATKYKCLATHTANVRLAPGQDFYADRVPALSSATNGNVTVTTNASVGGAEGWRALDHISTTYWQLTPAGEAWLEIAFAAPTRLRKYTATWMLAHAPHDWVFEGYNGVTWDALHSVANFTDDAPDETHEYTFVNETAYERYRLRVTHDNHAPSCLRELEVFDVDESWQDYWELVETEAAASKWTSGMRYYLGTEKRYTFNGGFDQRSSRWDAALQVCASSQATLMMIGTKIYPIVDKIKTPQQLITESNVTNFKESFLDLTNRATEINVQFKNAEKDYETDTISAFHSNSPANYGTIDVKPVGLVKASENWRLAKHHVMQNQRRRVVECDLGLRALSSLVGDVVYFQSEIPDWTDFHNGSVMSATASTITLDRTTMILDDQTYQILVQLADGTIVTKSVAPSMAPGEYDTLTITGTWGDALPEYGDVFAVGQADKVANTFVITNLVPTQDNGATITMMEWDKTLYEQLDAMTPEIAQTLPAVVPRYVKIEDLVLAEHVYFDQAGIPMQGIEVTWTPGSTGAKYQKGNVYLRTSAPAGGLPGAWELVAVTTDHRYLIPSVDGETAYDVMVQGVDPIGLIAPVASSAVAIASITTSDILDLISPPDAIAGLQVKDNALSGDFTGRDCTVVWTALPPVGANTANGGLVGGAPMLYEIVIRTTGAPPLRTAIVANAEFAYAFADNVLDAAGPSFTIEVTGQDTWGRKSETAASIVVTNPVPANVGTVTAESYEDGVKFSWPVSSDADLRGYKVRTKIGSDGTPSDWFETTKNTYSRDLSDLEKMDQGWGNAAVYIEIVAVDAYGQTSATAATKDAACKNTKPSISVGPTTAYGTFTDLASAVAKLPEGGGKIVIKNNPDGYTPVGTITLPDKNLEIAGEKSGTIVNSPVGEPLFNFTLVHEKKIAFSDFTIADQNSSGMTAMFTLNSSNPLIEIDRLTMALFGDGLSFGSLAFFFTNFSGSLAVRNSSVTGGENVLLVDPNPLGGPGNNAPVTLIDNVFTGQHGLSVDVEQVRLTAHGNQMFDQYRGGFALDNCVGSNVKSNTIQSRADQCTDFTGISAVYDVHIEGNHVLVAHLADATAVGILAQYFILGTDRHIIGNTVDIAVPATFGITGLVAQRCLGRSINSNIIRLKNNAGTATGLTLSGYAGNNSIGNKLSANQVGFTEGAGYNTGFVLAADTQENTGSGNLVSGHNTEISDYGASNTVKVGVSDSGDIDGGTWE